MQIHIVQKGDTLWKLAQQYNVGFEELKKANTHLADPDKIMPGMKIKVPAKGVPVKKEAKKEMPVPKVPKEQKEEHHPKVPPMYQPVPHMPKVPSSSQEQNVNINTNIYKPYPPTPPKTAPHYEEPKKKEEKQPEYNYKEVKLPEPPAMPEHISEHGYAPAPPMPYMMPPNACHHFVPVTPIMPGCSCGLPQHMHPYPYPYPMMPAQPMSHYPQPGGCNEMMPMPPVPPVSEHAISPPDSPSHSYGYSPPYAEENAFYPGMQPGPYSPNMNVYSPWSSGYKRENEEK
ncbi:SafA/ExsA family spore coat assembly protein [Bacillus piscicola]|uniref:SafA/ExsA family spore coat assembly protein n=1 Tax=Bacillus piscicola TaxID=1632684 RepID=UPI0023DDE98B|nr:SafA/ExsA family spore coat assembly protein [Bacillus piscicola]